jgi:hypothetical protein
VDSNDRTGGSPSTHGQSFLSPLSEGFKHIISTANPFGVGIVQNYQTTRLPLMRGNEIGKELESNVIELRCLTVPVTRLPRHADNVFSIHAILSLNPIGAKRL